MNTNAHTDAIAAFIASCGVTKCPPAAANATSLRQLRCDDERALQAERDARDAPIYNTADGIPGPY